MADDIVRTVIEAVDNASPVINQVGGSYEKLALDTEKANASMSRSASDTERSFASLAQSLNSGTNTTAAQASIGALNDMLARGEISADTYGAAVLQVGEQSGVMSKASIEAADQMTALNSQLASGKITAEQYAAGIKDIQEGLGSAEPEAKNFAETLTGLSTAAMAAIAGMGAALATFKKGWDFAEEGAKLNRIDEQFTATMQSMGLNAEDVMRRMKAAVRGTVDDEALAQAATRAFTQGIVTSGDQMARLLELARAKSVLLGRDTQDVFESIIQSADMLSTRGFKRLGINLESITKLTEDYAKAHHISAAEVDTETQKTILLNAALDKSKDAIDKANAAGDDQLTMMQRVETQANEVGDAVHAAFINMVAPALNTVATSMANDAKLGDAFTDSIKKMKDQVGAGKMTIEEYNRGLVGMIYSITQGNVALTAQIYSQMALNQAQADGLRSTNNLADGYKLTADQAAFLTAQTAQLDTGMHDNSLSALEATNAAGGLAKAYAEAAKEFSAASAILNAEITGAVGNEIDSYTKKNSDLHDKLEKVKTELQQLQAAQGSPIQNKHILSTAELTAAQAKLAVITEDLTAKTRKAGETDIEYNSRIANLQVQQENLTAKIQAGSEAVTGYVDNSKKIGELKATYDDLTGQIDAAANAHDIATKKILFNIASQQAAAIVAQDPSKAAIFASALNEVALKYGIIDQATKTATDNIIAANAQLAKDGNLDSYLGKLGMQAQLSSRTAEQATADAQTVINAHAAQVAAMGTPVVVKVDTKPLSDFQQHLQDKKPFDDYKAKLTDSVTKSTATATIIKTNISEIITQQALMANDPSINAYAVNVGAMTDTAHGYYQGLRADINETIARQIALNQALASGPAAGYTGNTGTSDNSKPVRTKPLGGGAAGGVDFVVPTGYPNDSYPLNVQSGERVIVQTPAQQMAAAPQPQGSSTGKPAMINNVTINDPLSSAIWLTYIYGQRRIEADSRM